jgi:hypothetical protein
MRRHLAIALVAGAVIFGAMFGGLYSTQQRAKPDNAAIYCAPWENWACYIHYQNCGPYLWNRWLGYSIDRCGYILV